jgi:hypothetical protein
MEITQSYITRCLIALTIILLLLLAITTIRSYRVYNKNYTAVKVHNNMYNFCNYFDYTTVNPDTVLSVIYHNQDGSFTIQTVEDGGKVSVNIPLIF